MSNPFQVLNAAAQPIEELRAVRIDRETEFTSAYDALVTDSHNVLLYGTRGAGKTFLIRLLEDDIRRNEGSVLSCIVNVASLSLYDGYDEVAAFPRAVLLQICTAMWTQLLGKPYLELRDRMNETGRELTIRTREEQTIQSVYRHLMQQQVTMRTSNSNTAGISLVAKGEKAEQSSFETKHSQILPFEFAEFAEQLIQDVLIPRGKSKIIVLCDESNHMKLYQQEQILERYLELFSSRRVQFLFVAGIGPWSEKEYLPTCFETTIALTGFKERGHVQALVEAALLKPTPTQLRFAPETIDVLFETFSGHPRRTLESCQRAYASALQAKLDLVDFRSVLRACRDIEEEERQYEKRIREISQRDG